MKKCSKCKIPKELEEFTKDKKGKDGLSYWCKLCKNNYKKIYLTNIDNWQKQRENCKKIYYNDVEKFRNQTKQYRKNNRQKCIDTNKKYYQNHKKERIFKNSQYAKERCKNDPNYKLIQNTRSIIYLYLKGIKSQKTIKYIGCTIKKYKLYLEKQFLPEMSWENHGKIWEIDHIIPISRGGSFHYTNTQPLFKTTEIARSFGYQNIIGNRDKNNNIII